MNDALEDYARFNAACSRRLVFRLGHDAGFYSEYNNMVLAVLWCLRHAIRFEMFSAESPLLGPAGWGTFFHRFCDESHDVEHRDYNYRYPRRLRSILGRPWVHIARRRFKRLRRIDLLTADVWTRVREQRFDADRIVVPPLGIDGTLQDACRVIVGMTYRLNDETRNSIEQATARIDMPSRYVGLHIRGGDKRRQSTLFHPDAYIARLRAVSPIREVFVLTDDHETFSHLVHSHPDYNFFTLCSAEESGYDHRSFLTSAPDAKARGMLNLLTSIEILRGAEAFVGTFSSNPGAFLGMAMPSERVHGLDRADWSIL